MKTSRLPNLRALNRLRPLLPYAAKLLPILTGLPIPGMDSGSQTDQSALDRQFGAMQTESRGLRTRVEDQSEQISRMAGRVDAMSAALERGVRQQEQLTAAFHGLATLLRVLCYAMLFLLLLVVTLSVVILLRMHHG